MSKFVSFVLKFSFSQCRIKEVVLYIVLIRFGAFNNSQNTMTDDQVALTLPSPIELNAAHTSMHGRACTEQQTLDPRDPPPPASEPLPTRARVPRWRCQPVR